jgi:hypothetical protein
MIIALLLSTLLGAAPPDWVAGASAQFPPERFVTGVGVAEDRGSAEARARAAISAVFETRVASVSRVKEEEVRTKAAGRDATASKIETSQDVVAVTAAVLEGASIAAAWTDPSGQVHALAVLDRAAASEVIRRRLGEGDASTVEALARLGKEPDRAEGARLAFRITALLGRRDGLAVRLRALDPSADTAPPPATADASGAAQRALASTTVRVDATGPGADAVAAAVARALLAVGLGTVGPQPKPDLVASVTVEETPPAASGAWTTARSAARVRLVREGVAEAWVDVAESSKVSATHPAEASRRASAALAKQVEGRFTEALRKQLGGP